MSFPTKEEFKTTKAYRIYKFLEIVFQYEPDRWVSKQTLIDCHPNLFSKSDSTSHDICSTLNKIRLDINEATSRGYLDHVVLLKNNSFKIAKDKEEAIKYCQSDYNNAMKLLTRYYKNIGVIKSDGKGTFLDENGEPIDSIKFYDPFNKGGNELI